MIGFKNKNEKPLLCHTATILENGKILVAGGSLDGKTSLARCELYDSVTKKWKSTDEMANPRSRHTATLFGNGKVFVVGGFTNTCEIYDSATERWTVTCPMSTERIRHTATLLLNGKILIVGGNTSETYDPDTDTWAVKRLVLARNSHTAVLLDNGQVLVTGGSPDGYTTLADCEIYDPETETWTATGSMSYARHFHTATQVENGNIIVIGGTEEDSSCEIYDGATRQWNSSGLSTRPRFRHTATYLENENKILIAGGLDAQGQDLNTREIYDVSKGVWTSAVDISEKIVVVGFDIYDGVGDSNETATVIMDHRSIDYNTQYCPATGIWMRTPLKNCLSLSKEIYDSVTGVWKTSVNKTDSEKKKKIKHRINIIRKNAAKMGWEKH